VQCKADGLVSSVSQYTKPPNQTKTYKEQRKKPSPNPPPRFIGCRQSRRRQWRKSICRKQEAQLSLTNRAMLAFYGFRVTSPRCFL